MELAGILLFMLVMIVILILLISLIVRVSIYYRKRYGFSPWSGVMLLDLGLLFCVLGTASNKGHIISLWIPLSLCLFTLYRDIVLCRTAQGFLCFVFQISMMFLSISIIIIVLAELFARALNKQIDQLSGTSRAVQEVKYAFILFPVFIRQ